MNTIQRFALLMLTFAGSAGLAQAAPAPAAATASRVEVTWNPPEQLSEVRRSVRPQRQPPVEWLEKLAAHLRQRADQILPPGEQLRVKFTDVKLAGDLEPWHGPQFDDVRIVKDLYPPRIDLHYQLIGSDGATLREGDDTLRDPAFLSRSNANDSDTLRYEKRMLDDWLRREFGGQQARARSR